MNELIKIEHQGQRVLTTQQLAENRDFFKRKMKQLNEQNEKLQQQVIKNQSGFLKNIFEKIDEVTLGYIYQTAKCFNKPMTSCVYFIKNKYSGSIKIGCSEHPQRRMNELKTAFVTVGMKPKLELLGLIVTFDEFAQKIEHDIHEFFKAKRLMGEWFDINEEDIFNNVIVNLADVTFFNGTFVDYSVHEWEYMYPVIKNYNLHPCDVFPEKTNIVDWLDFRPNKLVEIYNLVERNNIGFYDKVFMEKDGLLHQIGVKSINTNRMIDFRELKKLKQDDYFWGNLVLNFNNN